MYSRKCHWFVTFYTLYSILIVLFFVHKDHKSRRTIALQRASQHIKDSYRSFDLISQCQLEGMARHSTFISLLFYIRNHYLWTIFIHCVIIAHVSLSFLESKTKRTNDHWIINGTQFYVGV